jgi:hypothetical protein
MGTGTQAISHTVTVTVSRSENPLQRREGFVGLVWQVDPWTLYVKVGDTVTWMVDWSDCTNQPHVVIRPKPCHGWPLGSPPPLAGPAPVAATVAGPPGHYEYGIVVVCPGQGAVVIDPDMDVDE